VEGFSLFRRGIRPEWEDANNAQGGEWHAKCTDLETVDGWWLNTVMALVGETLGEGSEGVTGARMVDKSDGKQGHVGYRIEVWYRSGAEANTIHDHLCKIITEGLSSETPKFSRKHHPSSVKPAAMPGKKGAVATPRSAEGGAEAAEAEKEANAAEAKKVWQRQMRSIMAKITPEKAPRLAPQLAALISGADQEGQVMAADLIHKNAMHEALFAETYSNVCIALNKIEGFRAAIVDRCKTKFSARVDDLKACDMYSEVSCRKGARSNMRFIVELFKRDLIPVDDVIGIGRLLCDHALKEEKQYVGVHIEVLCELMSSGGLTMQQKKAAETDQLVNKIKELSLNKVFEVRHRFSLEAVVEQRRNGWKPRREKEKPMTQEELAAEKAAAQRAAAQSQSRGGYRGR